jgi:hypothetical protein
VQLSAGVGVSGGVISSSLAMPLSKGVTGNGGTLTIVREGTSVYARSLNSDNTYVDDVLVYDGGAA